MAGAAIAAAARRKNCRRGRFMTMLPGNANGSMRARAIPCSQNQREGQYLESQLSDTAATGVIASAAKQSRARAVDSGLLRRLRLLAMTVTRNGREQDYHS